MNKKLMCLIALIVAAVGGVLFYFLYWVKMPAYSIYLAYDAAKSHDIAKFERHVDLNSVYTKAVDAIFDKMLNKEQVIRGIPAQLRDATVAQLVAKTKEEIIKDKSNKPVQTAPAKPALVKEDNKDILSALLNMPKEYLHRYMEQRLNFQYMRFKGISTSEKFGNNEVIVTGKFHDIQLDRDFQLKLRMKELDDGKWQITEIVNVVDIVIERDKAVTARLAELNKEIKVKMNNVFTVKAVKTEAKNVRKGLLPVVEFTYTIDYTLTDSKTQASEVIGTYILKDANGKVSKMEIVRVPNLAGFYTMQDYSSNKILRYTWSKRDALGLLIGHDRGIMKKGIENYQSEFIVEKVILKDGSELAAIDVLPEPKD